MIVESFDMEAPSVEQEGRKMVMDMESDREKDDAQPLMIIRSAGSSHLHEHDYY